mgnify:CR=1 FL=1
MEKLQLHDKTFRPFIPNSRIEEAIDHAAAALSADFEGREEAPVLLCVLNGAIMFTAELMKRINFPMELMSIKLSSYQGTESSGNVLQVLGLTGNVEGRSVIICEDIVDTGNTIVALRDMLFAKGASDVKICAMLMKPDKYDKPVKIDYVGMEIPNDFIVGFGLDYDELGRNYKDIYILDQ